VEFTVRGISFGREAELTWREGRVTGDGRARELLEASAEALEGLPVGLNASGFAVSHGGHLSDPRAAYELMRGAVFQEVLEERGDVPPPQARPTGAS
jgi:hypothetical protein